MITKITTFTLFLFCIGTLSSCFSDKEDFLYPKELTCDTSGIQTYAAQVQPIISSNCYGCHSTSNNSSSGGGLNLEGYDNLKSATNNGLLLSAIKREAGTSPMPKNGSKLSECSIQTIEKWIDAGGLNN